MLRSYDCTYNQIYFRVFIVVAVVILPYQDVVVAVPWSKLIPRIVYYPSMHHPTYIHTLTSTYLKDFTHLISTSNTTALRGTEDEGIYCSVSQTPHHSRITQCYNYSPAFLCPHKLQDILIDVPPHTYEAGLTVLIPCDITGDPNPEIWWVKYNAETDSFMNITLTDRVIYTPNRHLVIKASRISDGGIYRCMGRNPCGRRCPGESACSGNGETVVPGHNFTLEVKSHISNTSLLYHGYLILDKTRYQIVVERMSHMCILSDMEKKCLSIGIDSGVYPLRSIESFVYGRTDVTSQGDNLKQLNADSLCILNCNATIASSNPEPDIFNIDCDEFDGLSHMCDFFDNSTHVTRFSYTVDRSHSNQIGPQSENVILTSQRRDLNFSVRDRNAMISIKCYQNLQLVQEDNRTRIVITRSVGFYGLIQQVRIHKTCIMRQDEGDYFCTTENLSGIAVSPHITVAIVKERCMEVTLLSRTKNSLDVSWPQPPNLATVYIKITPALCSSGDKICEIEERMESVKGSHPTYTIESLYSGCCYDVNIYTANKTSILFQNYQVSDFTPIPTTPQPISNIMMYYHNNDRLRIRWDIPKRKFWGSTSLHYRITLLNEMRKAGEGKYRTQDLEKNFIEITTHLKPNTTFSYGNISACSKIGCSAERQLSFRVPEQPFKPVLIVVQVKCNKVQVRMKVENNTVYSIYRYDVLKEGESRSISGTLDVSGLTLTEITNLAEGKNYLLEVTGTNSLGQETVLERKSFKTDSMCLKDKAIISVFTVLFFCFCLVLGRYFVIRTRRKKKREIYKSMYTMPEQETFQPEKTVLGDDISIVHLDVRDTSPAISSTNVRLKTDFPPSNFNKLFLSIFQNFRKPT